MQKGKIPVTIRALVPLGLLAMLSFTVLFAPGRLFCAGPSPHMAKEAVLTPRPASVCLDKAFVLIEGHPPGIQCDAGVGLRCSSRGITKSSGIWWPRWHVPQETSDPMSSVSMSIALLT